MAEERYYVLMGDSQVGPLSIDQVRNMRLVGTVKDDTLLWREGDPEWLPCSAYKNVLGDQITAVSKPPPEPVVAAGPEPIVEVAPEPVLDAGPELASPTPVPAPAPVDTTDATEKISPRSPIPEPDPRRSGDPDSPRITPSGIWREIEQDRERRERDGESSVDQIASSADEPTADQPAIPGVCAACGVEIRFCPHCGRPLAEHD